MRRFTTFHDHSTGLGHYLKKDGCMFTGSISETDPVRAVAALRSFEVPQGDGLVHFTLSMPKGQILSLCDWHEVAVRVLNKSGLPSALVPWFAWGREETSCDHVHIVSALETFNRRPLALKKSLAATDALERDIVHFLGLPEPNWHPNPKQSLMANLKKSEKVSKGSKATLADDLNHAFECGLPSSVRELSDTLAASGSDWCIEASIINEAYLTPRHLVTGEQVNPKDLGTGFSSSSLHARFIFAAAVRVARAAQTLRALAAYIHPINIPKLKRYTNEYDQTRRRGLEVPDRPPEAGRPQTLSATDAFGADGPRPDERLRRKAPGIHGRHPNVIRNANSGVSYPVQGNGLDRDEVGLSVGGAGSRRLSKGQLLIAMRRLLNQMRWKGTVRFLTGRTGLAIRLGSRGALNITFADGTISRIGESLDERILIAVSARADLDVIDLEDYLGAEI